VLWLSIAGILSQRRDPRRARLVAQQAIHALDREPLLPTSDAGLRDPGLPHDLRRTFTVRQQKNDPAAPDMLLPAVPIRRDRLETSPIRRSQVDGSYGSRRADSRGRRSPGIHNPTHSSDFIH
jgi:hypothetical protein